MTKERFIFFILRGFIHTLHSNKLDRQSIRNSDTFENFGSAYLRKIAEIIRLKVSEF